MSGNELFYKYDITLYNLGSVNNIFIILLGQKRSAYTHTFYQTWGQIILVTGIRFIL